MISLCSVCTNLCVSLCINATEESLSLTNSEFFSLYIQKHSLNSLHTMTVSTTCTASFCLRLPTGKDTSSGIGYNACITKLPNGQLCKSMVRPSTSSTDKYICKNNHENRAWCVMYRISVDCGWCRAQQAAENCHDDTV